MSLESFPAFLQNETFSAEITRRSIWACLQRGATVGSIKGGLVGPNDFLTVYGGAGLGVSSAIGEAFIAGGSTTSQGGYYCRGTSPTVNTPAASNPTFPRVDLICITIQDKAYIGSTDAPLLQILTGTPSPGASLSNLTGAPALPVSSLALAYVLIPAAATSITNADILNVSQYVYFGPNIFYPRAVSANTAVNSGDHVLATGNPVLTLPAPFPSARVKVTYLQTSAATVQQHSSEVIYGLGMGSGVASFLLGSPGATATVESDGSAWYVTAGMQDSGWTAASLTNSWTSAAGASSSSVPGYRLQGDRVWFHGALTPGGASGTAAFTLPAGFRPAANVWMRADVATDTTRSAECQIVASTGVVTLYYTAGAVDVSLEGMSFSVY